MKRFFELVYLYTGFFIFGIAMLIVFPIVGLAQLLPSRKLQENIKLWCMKFWASSFYTFGVWFYHKGTIQAQEQWPKGSLIIVANHNSLLDTPALYLMLKRFALPLAKIELTKAPVFGHLCAWITLAVDRKSAESRKRAMSDMTSYLADGGSLVIFPEGKTNKSDKPLQPFEPGAFRLSFESGVPLVPVLVRNSRYCLAATKPMTLRPGIVTTEPGPVFNPAQYPDALSFQKAVVNWYEVKLGMA